MAQYPNQNNLNELASWAIVAFAMILFWPLGLVLLFKKLSSCRTDGRKRHPYDLRQEGRSAPAGSAGADALPSGKGLVAGGTAVTAVFAVAMLGSFAEALSAQSMHDFFSRIALLLGFCGAGVVMLYCGLLRARKSRRFRRYLTLIGKREVVTVATLAEAMPETQEKTLADLQEMLDEGVLPRGYLDHAGERLVLTEDGLPEEAPAPVPPGMEREDAILREIREVNDAVQNPELSAQIDRVGEITGRIFACLRENPAKEAQLRSFLSYYLPTTLKILRAYAQMESQGVDGENIAAAKARIEGMMDKVVEGFEKQLDRLFQDDALDVTSDVAVLEQMLRKDGLSQDGNLTMGG